MKKRDFLKTGAVLSLGTLVSPLSSCQSSGGKKEETAALVSNEFTLPDLPYAYDALEPYVDTQTMQIHHDRHHAGYVKKLNAALQGNPLQGKDLISILTEVSADDTAVRNNGGGHFNHSLFWQIMAPGGGQQPSGALADALNATFGSVDAFLDQFAQAAATRFGSGWAWLSVDASGQLFVSSTPNQDNPLMDKIVDRRGTPILGIDVWEHAYYLKYQNRRKEYIQNFTKIINWDQVAQNLASL